MSPYDFALLAQEAYSAKPDIGEADSASRAIVRTTEAGLCVAFPGTDNVDGWIADLDAARHAVPGVGEVHRGFWQSWQAIAPAVTASIGNQPVTFVGHSLGAAISIMAALSGALAGRPPVAVYGFEPPRVSVGPGVARVLADVPVYLYRNGKDIVPDVPPDMSHAAGLTGIGKASLPFPNVRDHFLARVIPALAGTRAVAEGMAT